MNIPNNYIVTVSQSDEDEIDSVITEDDFYRREKLLANSNHSRQGGYRHQSLITKGCPRYPRRRMSYQTDQSSRSRSEDDATSSPKKPIGVGGDKCLPSLPKRRGSISLEKLIFETSELLSLDFSDCDSTVEEEDASPEQEYEKRSSDPPSLPQRRETLLLEEFALNLDELRAMEDEDEEEDEDDLDLLDIQLSKKESYVMSDDPESTGAKPIFLARRRCAIRPSNAPDILPFDLLSSDSISDSDSEENENERGEGPSSEMCPPKQPRRKPSLVLTPPGRRCMSPNRRLQEMRGISMPRTPKMSPKLQTFTTRSA